MTGETTTTTSNEHFHLHEHHLQKIKIKWKHSKPYSYQYMFNFIDYRIRTLWQQTCLYLCVYVVAVAAFFFHLLRHRTLFCSLLSLFIYSIDSFSSSPNSSSRLSLFRLSMCSFLDTHCCGIVCNAYWVGKLK